MFANDGTADIYLTDAQCAAVAFPILCCSDKGLFICLGLASVGLTSFPVVSS